MERIDDDEAHELAAKWINTIKSNVGLNNACTSYTDANRDSCKQVQQNSDVTDEKRYRCKEGCSARKPTFYEFAKPNAKGTVESEEPWACCRVINDHQLDVRRNSCGAMFFKSPDEQQSEPKQFLDGHVLINDNIQVAATSGCNYTSTLINNDQQTNGHTDKREKEKKGVCRFECATRNELFDIWGFNEEQRKQARCYLLDKADEGSILHEKENIPLLDQTCHADGASDVNTAGESRLENVDIKINSKKTSIPNMTIKDDYAVSGPNGKFPFEEGHCNQEAEKTRRFLVDCKEKFCKVCPGCSEVNLQNANWCEECGKALVTVEITRKSNAPQSDLLQSALPLDIEKQIVNSNKISSSKLNPNSAEFVSAFAKPMQETHSQDNDFLLRHDTVTGNETISGTGWEDNASNSCMPDPIASCNLQRSKIGRKNTRKPEQQHSANLTDVMKFSRKRDKDARKWEEDNRKGRSYSTDKPSTCSQYFYSGLSEEAPKGCISSVNPSGERSLFYQLPSSNPESLGYNQVSHSFGAQSQRQRSASWCNVTQNSPCGNLLQMSYSAVGSNGIDRRVHCPFDDELQRLNVPAVYQGFDFQNPVLENSSLGQCNSFDEGQFSRDLVQSQLNNQIALLYGNWEASRAHCISSTDNGMHYQPLVAYPQHVSPNGNLQSWRMYRKKKVVDNFIDSPRTPRSVTRKSNHHAKFKKKEKQNHGYSELKANAHHIEQDDEKGNPAGAYQHEEPGVQLHSPVPPLALEDLDVYDQVLSLIRTAREEELPYLCLPEEIVLYIFSFLSTSDISKCARVCRQFRRISLDESLWKEIIIRKRSDLNDEILAKIAQKAPVSLTITQCHSNKVTEAGLRNLFRSCGENLQDVDFSSCSGKALVGELILLQLTFRCRKLRSLDISWSNVSDIGIQAFAENVEQLECLCMNGCQTITDETTRAIARKHTKSVRVIEMFGCFNITHVSLLILQQFCPNIETLNVGQCHKITDTSVSEFAKRTKGLENIDLRGCIQIKDTAIKDLASNCLNLSTLVVANCPLITDASMITIAANLPRIRCLDVCGCPKISERGIQALAKSCTRLEIIDLSSTKATDKAVSSLANYCYQTLESVKLSFCHSVTESSLEQLAKKCNRLCSLHLYGCKRVKNLKRVQDCRRALKIES